MAELTLRPLLAHKPEASPPSNWRVLLLPALLAVVGMLIAFAAATTGQDARRAREVAQRNFDLYYWRWEVDDAKLRNLPEEEIAKKEKILAQKEAATTQPIISYARYGRQFTPWDGYRYEEIIDQGYLYHMPDDPVEIKNASNIRRPGWPEARAKNVVWYPLFPMLGDGVMRTLHVSSTNSLTIVSWTCCLLGAVVTFLYARRHYYNRMPVLDAPAGEQHPARKWDLAPQDAAALWVVAALLFGPCSIFLYANFTESLFVLLLASFLYCIQARWWWRAALVAGIAASCRSQGVLFGPVLALAYLLRSNQASIPRKVGIAAVLGMVSGTGLLCYMIYLQVKFHDPLAFMHAQKYWNVGVSLDRILYAANPVHAMTQVLWYGFYQGEVDWPRLWEALCLIWPPVVLLVLGGRYLSFELEVVGWMLWGLPYVSNSMAGNPPFDTQWMSMGRFMAVMLPAFIICGAVFVRLRWLGLVFIVLSTSAFAVFAYKYGAGAWVG